MCSWKESWLRLTALSQSSEHHTAFCTLEAAAMSHTLQAGLLFIHHCRTLCFSPLTHVQYNPWLKHTQTHTQTDFKASRRSPSDGLVLLMSRAQSKQGHLCRTSPDKEKSQQKNGIRMFFQFVFSASEVTDCWTTAYQAKLLLKNKPVFSVNTPSASVWFWIPWMSACDVFLPHSHDANQIFVWPFCPPGLPWALRNIESLTFVLLRKKNKQTLDALFIHVNCSSPFWRTHVLYDCDETRLDRRKSLNGIYLALPSPRLE